MSVTVAWLLVLSHLPAVLPVVQLMRSPRTATALIWWTIITTYCSIMYHINCHLIPAYRHVHADLDFPFANCSTWSRIDTYCISLLPIEFGLFIIETSAEYRAPWMAAGGPVVLFLILSDVSRIFPVIYTSVFTAACIVGQSLIRKWWSAVRTRYFLAATALVTAAVTCYVLSNVLALRWLHVLWHVFLCLAASAALLAFPAEDTSYHTITPANAL